MHSVQEQACVICEQTKLEGITIYEKWMCTTCELEIVQTDMKDPKYSFFIQQLRRIWYKGEV